MSLPIALQQVAADASVTRVIVSLELLGVCVLNVIIARLLSKNVFICQLDGLKQFF